MVFQFTLKDLKNYKNGQKKLKSIGKKFVFKNKPAEAEELSITEHERLQVFVEYLEMIEE